jgi:hypothetical protein
VYRDVDGGVSVQQRSQRIISRRWPRWRNARGYLVVLYQRAPWRYIALGLVIGLEMLLLLVSLVPDTVWASHGWPSGPIPAPLFPLTAGLFYLLPALIGGLCRHWQAAIFLATLPAWVDLGIFAVAAAARVGPFYLAQEAQAGGTVSTLELFAALGVFGWLARYFILGIVVKRK